MSNQLTKVKKLKKVLNAPSVQEQFENALGENSGAFVASIIDLYNNDDYLKKCDPNKVVMEALKAATLKLPINRQLGFAYIVPYKKKGVPTPEFQIGYKGYIQLAMRTGQYKHFNAGEIYEGEEIKEDKLTGNIEITGEKESDEIKGYFAYMELTNGFSKTVHWSKKDVVKHAKKYSKSYGHNSSAWQTNFDQMARKTVIRNLLSKYGIMTTEMITAFSKETSYSPEEEANREIDENANNQTIDIEAEQKPVEDKKEQTEQEEPEF